MRALSLNQTVNVQIENQDHELKGDSTLHRPTDLGDNSLWISAGSLTVIQLFDVTHTHVIHFNLKKILIDKHKKNWIMQRPQWPPLINIGDHRWFN